MNKYFYYFSVLLFFVMIGCRKTSIKFPIQENTIVEEIENCSIFLGLPIDMKVRGWNVYISDFYGDSLLLKYDLKTSQVNRFGTKGGGPNEIMPPTTLMVHGNKLYAYSKSNFKYGYYNLSDDTERIIQDNDYSFLYTPSSQTIEIVPLSENKFLSSGYFKEGRYAVLNEQGSINDFFGEYPNYCDGEKERPFEVKAMFHQVKFLPNYNLNKVVAISNYIMDIIDFSNPELKYKRILLNDYNYNFKSGNILQTEKSNSIPKGIVSATVSDKFIYTLFNPNIDLNGNKNNEIWIFDWTGKTIKKVIPNININLITIGTDGSIYAITAAAEPSIVNIRI
jgi:hypothetical protein